MKHRALYEDGEMPGIWLTPAKLLSDVFWQSTSKANTALIYATSVSDWTSTKVAALASHHGIKTFHVLDNWSSYAQRLFLENGERVDPSAYCVMDELAKTEAIDAGVPAAQLVITGHPNLAFLVQERDHFELEASNSKRPTTIMFVSEPAKSDTAALSRGYDELVVAELFLSLLKKFAPLDKQPINLTLVPHPRENRSSLESFWLQCISRLEINSIDLDIVEPTNVRRTLHCTSHVIGMTSILLYEAYLLGKTVMSLQPGLKTEQLRTLSKRSGVLFCDTDALARTQFPVFLERQSQALPNAAADLRQHETAAQTILDLIINRVKQVT